MLPPGALQNADNPGVETGQKVITIGCSFILNQLNFVGRGVQQTQNFQVLAHGLIFIRQIFFIYLMTNTKRKYISMLYISWMLPVGTKDPIN